MNKLFLRITLRFLLFAGLIIFSSPSFAATELKDRVDPVVTAEWVKQNSSESGVIILHVTSARRDYENGHIPGARFLWAGSITVSTEEQSTLPAPVEDVTKKLRALGVNNDSHVILCGIYGNLLQVCRVFVNLEHYGLRGRVSILNGGFEAWQNAGYESSVEVPVPARGRFKPVLYENLTDGEFVKANLKNTAYVITDARPKPQYDGTTGTPRAGHIPGAINLPQTDMYDARSFMFVSNETIKSSFEKLGIPVGSRPLLYCHTGNSASVDYIAAIIAGYEPLIYDGSMEEWASRFDWPMEKKE